MDLKTKLLKILSIKKLGSLIKLDISGIIGMFTIGIISNRSRARCIIPKPIISLIDLTVVNIPSVIKILLLKLFSCVMIIRVPISIKIKITASEERMINPKIPIGSNKRENADLFNNTPELIANNNLFKK